MKLNRKEYMKAYRKDHLWEHRISSKKHTEKYPERASARTRAKYQLKDTPRPPCCRCGNPGIEYHHADYSRPLHVVSACLDCHTNMDMERRTKVISLRIKLGHVIQAMKLAVVQFEEK